MGPDGHVASIFPNTPEARDSPDWVLPITNSPKPPPERITLSLSAINAAANVAIVALGQVSTGVRGGCYLRARASLHPPPLLSVLCELPSMHRVHWVPSIPLPASSLCPFISIFCQGKAEIVQRVLEVQSLPGALPAQLVRPKHGEDCVMRAGTRDEGPRGRHFLRMGGIM